jgi:FlaA1/EpsC-like NDP-sugar epimerase/ActR/RegA family two-component response regulator
MINQFTNRHYYVMIALDILAFAASLLLAYTTRFEFPLSPGQWTEFLSILPWVITLKSVIFLLLGAYRGLWRYTSLEDGVRLFKASVLSLMAIIALLTSVAQFQDYSRYVYIADSIFTCSLCLGLRLAVRFYYSAKRHAIQRRVPEESGGRTRLLIVGAGDAAEKITREIGDTGTHYVVVCCVDDDRTMRGGLLHGVPICGPIDHLPAHITRYQAAEVLIAIPRLPGDRVLRIVEMCKQSGVRCRTLPPFSAIIDGQVSVKNVRDVAIENLLGRAPVKYNDAIIRTSLEGACVMVTGAGGSIGSEIARQVALFHPRRLILFEIGETPLFEIHRELQTQHPELDVVPIIGDVSDEKVVNRVFTTYLPQIVFHAAAYKHVPLMEAHPDEAVLNNVRGTRLLAAAARRVKTERFVLISTDKAVRPCNVMGATKRLCELMIEAMYGTDTQFVAVRFGNVLGSNGSVVTIFQKQIAAREPITVTDPTITRYFMTIPEAVHLVLRCGAMQESQGVLVLDMGSPVRIIDLARNMIRLSGLREGQDLDIVITGLRPGEKLHEELVTYGEGLFKTAVEGVNILRQSLPPISPTMLSALVRRLEQVASSRDIETTRSLLMRVVTLDQEARERNLLKDAEAAVVPGLPSGRPDDRKALPPSTLKALVIDEDAGYRTLLVGMLSKKGFCADTAESKQAALARLACEPCDYDLVLCNFNLPDGTGLELRADQPAATRSIPFVLMIDFADPRVNDILKTDAQCPILIKPFSLAQLMTAIPRGNVRRAAAPTLTGDAER